MVLFGVSKVSLAADTAAATVDPEFDVTTGWTVTKYTSDLTTTIPKINEIFIQGEVGETGVKTASAHGTNLGNATFEAQRVIHLKGGKKYSIKLLYGLVYNPKVPSPKKVTVTPSAFIDFNGTTTYTLEANAGNYLPFSETVEPTTDTDYTITMGFTVPRGDEIYTMIGSDTTDPDSGINEIVVPDPEPDPKPVPDTSSTTETSDSTTTSTTDGGSTTTSTTDGGSTSTTSDPSSTTNGSNGNGGSGKSGGSGSYYDPATRKVATSRYYDPADPADPRLPQTNEKSGMTVSMVGYVCLSLLGLSMYWMKKNKGVE